MNLCSSSFFDYKFCIDFYLPCKKALSSPFSPSIKVLSCCPIVFVPFSFASVSYASISSFAASIP